MLIGRSLVAASKAGVGFCLIVTILSHVVSPTATPVHLCTCSALVSAGRAGIPLEYDINPTRIPPPILNNSTMADTPDTPAYGSTRTVGSRPASRKSASSARSKPSSRTTEETPLLQRRDSEQEEANEDEGLSDTHPRSPAASSLLRSLSTSGETEHTPKAKRRWPSLVALLILCVVVILIMVLGFVVPHAVEEYAMQAVDFKPTRLALDELTKAGMRVRVEGDFKMDASRVKKKSVRNLGRFSTWVAKEAETGPADVDIYLPEYGNVLVGKAKVPGIKVNIRNGRTTHVDVLADLEPGSFDGLRTIVDDYLEGRLGKVSVKGRAKVPLRSGIFRLGEQIIEQSVALEG